MNILIFFSVTLLTIGIAIFLNRLVHSPLLIGFIVFSVFLLIAGIFGGITLIVIAIVLGILATIIAFLDCIISTNGFLRRSNCLRATNAYSNLNNEEDNGNSNNDDTLTIVNSNGQVLARINGDTVNCRTNNRNNCGCLNR